MDLLQLKARDPARAMVRVTERNDRSDDSTEKSYNLSLIDLRSRVEHRSLRGDREDLGIYLDVRTGFVFLYHTPSLAS